MKAIQLQKIGDTSGFKMVDLPDPTPKKGEVRIQLKAAGFNPVDYKIREGEFGDVGPVILGADGSGIIDAVGEGITRFQIGDQVAAFVFGQGSNGTYAESVCVPEAFVVKKPTRISYEEAAAFPLVALTAYRCLANACCFENPSPIFIAGGAGGVGSAAIQIAKAFGCGDIYTLARSEESLHFLHTQLGLAKERILLCQGLSISSIEEQLISLNNGTRFQVAFDFVGKEMKDLCLSVADFQGHVVSIVPEKENFPCNLWTRGVSQGFRKNLAVHFVFVGAESFAGNHEDWNVYQIHLEKIVALIESGKLLFPQPTLIGPFSVATVQKAHEELESTRVKGKLVMKIS